MFTALTHIAIAFGLVLLLGAALHDIAVRTVPNGVSVALVVLGLAVRSMGGDLLLGLEVAAAVFVVAALLWFWRMMGGADTKLLGAVALVAPPERVLDVMLMTALCGGILALVYLVMSRLVARPAEGTRHTLLGRLAKAEQWRLSRRGPLPYAVAIAGGSIISLSPLVAG